MIRKANIYDTGLIICFPASVKRTSLSAISGASFPARNAPNTTPNSETACFINPVTYPLNKVSNRIVNITRSNQFNIKEKYAYKKTKVEIKN